MTVRLLFAALLVKIALGCCSLAPADFHGTRGLASERQALDRAENALENPWNGAGRTIYRTLKAIAILREALEKATGESAQFLVGEIEGLEKLLTLLH